MNQGDNSEAQTCEGLPPSTLAATDQIHNVCSSTETQPSRRPRFGTSGSGRKFGGALTGRRKWPPRRVSFPTNDTHLVTGYLEPANPWEYAENVNREDLISTYRKSCIRHNTNPLESVLDQLENLEITDDRCDTLSLSGQRLEQNHCESLEEILKRVQFKNINLAGTSLDDESCVALFDMMEYYESAVHLNISSNQNIGTRGWQACSHMIKKTQCLEQLEAKNVTLNEQHMPILSRALRIASHLQVLKLENSGLSGRPTVILVAALKLNTGLKELYLADNDLGPQDAMQLGALLRTNCHLQLLDISNNNVQDSGVGHISDGVIEQRIDDKDGKGLSILVLWNNHITRNSSQHFSRTLARCKTLEMLNIGQNMLTNETLHIIKESLQQNRTLLRLGMQSTHLTCEAAVALADIIRENHVIQRIDLRDNHLQIAGLAALAFSLKKNNSVTQLDLDDQPRKKLDGTLEQYLALVSEIRGYCTHNEEPCSTDESTEESESPQHRSRLSSVSSRKISLTCQTLPRSPPTIFPDVPGRMLLEPKRTSGGRLRSPAPSPIPSPVASPIPSPSRGRFVVSRVSETSLSSTNSSASSSPVTPPSRSSSPTCFFPSATGASRFRVTVVELAEPKLAPKSVITSANTNVTVGFQFKVDSGDQANPDDSDDVFKPDLNTNASNPIATKNKTDVHVSPSVCPSSCGMTHLSEITVKIQKTGEKRCVVKDIINKDSKENSESKIPSVCTVSSKNVSEVCVLPRNENRTVKHSVVDDYVLEDVEFDFGMCEAAPTNIQGIAKRGTQLSSDGQDSSINSKFASADCQDVEVVKEVAIQSEMRRDNSTIDNSTRSRSRKSSCIQKPLSSLDKLLDLFQHPGSLFSGSTSVEKLDLKNPLQNSVNSVIALGDKFHQYLREGRGSRESSPQPPLHRSVSDAPQPVAKLDPVKSCSVPQLSSIQTLSSIFAPSTLVENNEECTSENGFSRCSAKLGKYFENSNLLKHQITSIEFENNTHDNNTSMPRCECEGETLDRISEQPLPENVQSKANDTCTSGDLKLKNPVEQKTTVSDSNEIVNSVPANVLDNKQIICVPKLKNIPEYSLLEISGIEVEPGGMEHVKKVERIICDSSTTDSINLTSDRKSSPRNIICDKQNIVNVVTLGASQIVGNLKTPPVEYTTNDVSQMFDDTVTNRDVNLCKNDDSRRDDSNNRRIEETQEDCKNINLSDNRIIDELNNIDDDNVITGSEKVTSMTIIHTIRTDISEQSTNVNPCQLENTLHPESTTIDGPVHSAVPVLDTTCEDNGSNIDDGSVQIINSCLFYDDQLMKNCNHRILEAELLAANHHNQYPSQIARKIRDKSLHDAIQSSHESLEAACATVDTNSGHHTNPNREHPYDSIDCAAEFDRSDGDELIFNMTDISTDTVTEDHVSSMDSTMNQSIEPAEIQQSHSNGDLSSNIIQLKSNMQQVVQSPTNMLIEISKGVHRNSHDSGIEETNLSMSADSVTENAARALYQESTESGIDSEWSFAGLESDSCNELFKDNVTVSTEKDGINNNMDNGQEFNETIRELHPCQTSNVLAEIVTGEGIVKRTATEESDSPLENGHAIIVPSIRSKKDIGEKKTEDSEKVIEKLLVEVSSEGRDNEISGCSAVVCSTSHQGCGK